MNDGGLDDLDFDELARLAQEDPEAFEALRTHKIQQLIEAAPEPSRRRLLGLQWQIDMERAQSDSALSACVRISRMMWDSVAGTGGLLERIDGFSNDPQTSAERASAKVLPFTGVSTSDDGHTVQSHDVASDAAPTNEAPRNETPPDEAS